MTTMPLTCNCDFNKTTYSLIRFLFSKIKLVLTYSNKVTVKIN